MSKSAGKKFLKDEKIKSENKKAVKKFALLMIVGGIIGAVIGGVSNMTSVQGMGMSLKDGIAEFCYVISPWAVVICNAGAILCGMIYYQKGKKLYLALRDKDEDEAEEEYERIDAIFSKGMIAINIGMVVSYGCFACFAVNIINYAEESGIKMLVLLCIVLVAFLGGMLGGVKLSQLYVDLMRVMNPRLSGSVYDSNFHKMGGKL